MVWSSAFSWHPPMDRTLSSAKPAWLLASSSTVVSPVTVHGAARWSHRNLLQQRAEDLDSAGAA